MSAKIDWLSWSMPLVLSTHTDESYALSIERAFHDMFGVRVTAETLGGRWEPRERGRAPYKDGWEKPDAGLTMFASRDLNHMTVEASGRGCDWLREQGVMNTVLACAASRMTRVDIAVDIECDVDPADFAKEKTNGRIEATGDYVSSSGRTFYVGSQKSERFARVYRYNAPHPRSHLLRVEMVFRREHAKMVAKRLCEVDEDSVASEAGSYYGWLHEAWAYAASDTSKITPVSAERNAGKTVFWLVNTVAPSFRRLVEQGVITDPVSFIQEYFLGESGQDKLSGI